MVRLALAAATCAALSGCATYNQVADPERTKQVTGIDKHSAYPVTRREYFERINLLELIDPDRQAEKNFKDAWDKAALSDRWTDEGLSTHNKWGAWYDLSFAWFRKRTDMTDEQKRRQRNSVQERILSASISRCNVFKTYLRREQSENNFLLGLGSTIFGGLGAMVNGADASRALAGTAGIFSGVRAEYNQTFFSNLAVQVIIKGIETRQELVYQRIQGEGQPKGIGDYPLEAAVKDAVYFDGLCTTVVGLAQANASIDMTADPGLEALTRGIIKARIAREAAEMPREQLLDPDTMRKLESAARQVGMSLVGSRGAPAPQEAETDLYVAATKMVERIDGVAKSVAAGVESEFLARRQDLAKTLSEDARKALKAAPKVQDEVAKAVTEAFVKPMKLAECYAQFAAPELAKRDAAVKALDLARTKAESEPAGVVKAEIKLRETLRGVQSAHDKLKEKEQLLVTDLDLYRKGRVDAIKAAAKIEDLDTDRIYKGTPTRTATTGAECQAPA